MCVCGRPRVCVFVSLICCIGSHTIKRCTETAVSLLTETDATDSLAYPEERVKEDEREREERCVGREG